MTDEAVRADAHFDPLAVETTIVERAVLACRSVRFNAERRNPARVAGIPAFEGVDYCTIQTGSEPWGLNERQHYGFTVICTAVLDYALASINVEHITSLQYDELLQARSRCQTLCRAALAGQAADSDAANDTSAPQTSALFGFITGPAGTGKSRIIDAALDFARRWNCADAVCVTATSGAAAALISAQTWQSAVGVGIEDQPKSRPSADKMREWARRGILIVDEIGMGGAKTIARIDLRLRELKDKTKLFGGVHVLVFGDFRQLKPVADIPVYQNPDRPIGSRASQRDQHAVSIRLQADGHRIWSQSMNAGVELVVNERAAESKPYAELLERFSNNSPTSGDLQTINSRVVTNVTQLPADITTVVPTNEERMAINNKSFDSYCQVHAVDPQNPGVWTDRGALVINATVEPANPGINLASKRLYLLNTAFSGIKTPLVKATTGNTRKEVLGRLRLIVGGPVMVLNNDQTISGIVSGTMATLVDVILQPHATVHFDTTLTGGGGAHCVDAAQVSGLILRYTDPKWARQGIFSCLPPGCFPLKLPGWRSVKVHSGGAFVEVRTKQFQCTPAFALTGNKVQGATLANVLVANWRAPKGKTGSDGWIYVVLSRVRRLESLFALEPLPDNPFQYKARAEIAAEMERLRQLIFNPTLSFLRL